MPVIGRGPLRIAVLIKQVPASGELELGPDGRLVRTGVALEMNAYCRRAVGKGVELAQDSEGTCCVLTLGPPAAEDSLREAVAWGADEGILITGPQFAGSDTLATARALARALTLLGPFDLVLCGRNSVDAETGQVPAQIAEMLGLPMAAGARAVDVFGDTLEVYCEYDDGWVDASIELPALITCAERLADPAKVPAEGRAAVPAERLRTLTAEELGPGPWGASGSPTSVGATKVVSSSRLRMRMSGSVHEQVRSAVRLIERHGGFAADPASKAESPAMPPPPEAHGISQGPVIAVLIEPDRDREARELLGAAAMLAAPLGGSVAALGPRLPDPETAGSWGADVLVPVEVVQGAEDMAAACVAWSRRIQPWAILGPATMWGREVSGRAAVGLDAGLAGDAVALEVDYDGRLICWKPAFSGGLLAAVTFSSPVQMATVRSGALPAPAPRVWTARPAPAITTRATTRVRVRKYIRDDEVGALAAARVVLAVGAGVAPDQYPLLEPLRTALGAELAATRKVTDLAWQPRARQIGITGRSVAPRLFLTVATSGSFNHLVGARGAGLIVAVNRDPAAPAFDGADIGIVADWRAALPLLTAEILALRTDQESVASDA